MSSESLKALEEIKALGHQVDLAVGLADLEPIRLRIEHLARQYPGDQDIQRAVDVAKRLLLNRATRLTMSPDPPTIQTAPTTIPEGLTPPPPLPPEPKEWKSALWIGLIAGIVLSVVLIAILVNVARKRNVNFASLTATDVTVQIATTPAGASIRVNGETKCTSNCKLTLPPGAYQITAFLDGYEPAATGVNLTLGKPETLNLTLEARPQTVRILSDLEQGKARLDQQPPADLQDGEYVFEGVAPGSHTISVTAPNSVEASFNLDLAPGTLPMISGPVNTKNVLAILVSSFAGRGRVITSSGPWQLAVNGKPEDAASPTGVDLKNFQPGLDEIAITQGKVQHNFKEDFGPGPALTAFLKTDRNVGTLIVSTNENNARIFLNGKEYSRKTQGGQVRIQAIGSVEVRVMKAGFENPPIQKAEVRKGSEVRLEFKLQPIPQVAALRIEGATPGAEVLIDQRQVGTVAYDGSFQNGSVAPGDHVIGMRHDRFVPKQFQRTFTVGQTVLIGGPEAALVAERPPPPPPPPPAPKPEPPAPKPAPKVTSMDGFDNPGAWSKQDNGVWRHRGAGVLTYKLPSAGVYTFAVYLVRGGSLFRGGRIRWVVDYMDSKNYIMSELDDTNLTIRDVVNGKTTEHAKVKHNVDSKDKAWAIQIEVSPGRLIQRIQKDNEWVDLDNWNTPDRKFADGKFGFLIQGNDEIGVSDFKFTPAR